MAKISSETFIERLNRAKAVKIVDKGKVIKIPATVLQQARDMAIEIVAYDKGVTVDVIIGDPKKYDSLVEKTFHAYLDGYAESVIPAANRGRHRAEAALRVLESFADPEKGFFADNFKNESSKDRETKTYILKSGIFKIADIFVEGVAKIPKSTTEEAVELDRADLGMNFASGLKGKEAAAVILFNQYYFKTLVIWLYMMTAKLYELGDNEIRPYLMEKMSGKTIGELKDKEASAAFFNEIKLRTARILSSVYLPDSLK